MTSNDAQTVVDVKKTARRESDVLVASTLTLILLNGNFFSLELLATLMGEQAANSLLHWRRFERAQPCSQWRLCSSLF